ncbi:polysaccharide biosynthesis C-terminal domain-containing protein [uncultured Ilyobacter sp.]|uniref:oligosaccharide flippase family protein n=1 Tax=uncultured Ilyobacter sp. TaxID=544433 RepID=UPI0029C072CB|nr:polysaccharide biosynthesis C-terminal domain-containing protein [uncultured Ilyobacter sp.]
MQYVKSIGSNLILQIIQVVIGIFTSIFIYRGIGAEGNGYARYLLLLVNIIGQYGHLGILNSVTHFLKKKNYRREEIITTNVIYSIIIFLIYEIIIIFFKAKGKIINEYNTIIVIMVGFIILFNYISIIASSVYTGENKLLKMNRILKNMQFIRLICLFSLYLTKSLTVNSFLIYTVIESLVRSYLLIKKLDFNFDLSCKINTEIILKEFKYGFFINISALLIFLNYRVDQIMVKEFLNLKSFGVYSLGVTLSELLLLIPKSVSSALMAKLYNVDRSIEKGKVALFTVKYTFLACLLLSCVGMFLAELVPLFYGDEYRESVLVIRVLFWGITFASLGKVLSSFFLEKEKNRVVLNISVLTFIINFIINLYTIPKYGIVGAALASSVSYFIYGTAYLILFLKNVEVKVGTFLFKLSNEEYNFIKKFKALLPLR